MVAANGIGPSKLVAEPFRAQFNEPQPGALFAANTLIQSDAGGYDYVHSYARDGVIYTIRSRSSLVPTESAASGLMFGASYDGPLSGVSVASLGYSSDVDLDAAAFRSAMNTAPASSWDALTQQANARIADGTYDRFSDLGHAITDDGSIGQRLERFAHAMTYGRPDAAE